VEFADEFVQRFRWIDGHADMLSLFTDGAFLRRTAEALASPFKSARVTKVAGVEARGFILGTAVSLQLDAGFVAIRKHGAIHPGPKATVRATPDWRGNQPELALQRQAITTNDQVLLVDDWIETGSQALAARQLIEECGGTWTGLSVLVDQSKPAKGQDLDPVASVVTFDALPPSVA